MSWVLIFVANFDSFYKPPRKFHLFAFMIITNDLCLLKKINNFKQITKSHAMCLDL